MRLYLMQLATAASGAPVPGYLIQTDDGSNVLVDTGFPESMIGAYREPGGEGRPRVDEGDWVVNQLASIGVAPGDIRYLVCTPSIPTTPGATTGSRRPHWSSSAPSTRRRGGGPTLATTRPAPPGITRGCATAFSTATANCCRVSS